jgi:hypothetical protein
MLYNVYVIDKDNTVKVRTNLTEAQAIAACIELAGEVNSNVRIEAWSSDYLPPKFLCEAQGTRVG